MASDCAGGWGSIVPDLNNEMLYDLATIRGPTTENDARPAQHQAENEQSKRPREVAPYMMRPRPCKHVKIKEADEIVFCFPVWWGDAPAILKNWLDYNFTSGFAFKYDPIGVIKLLKGTIIVIL